MIWCRGYSRFLLVFAPEHTVKPPYQQNATKNTGEKKLKILLSQHIEITPTNNVEKKPNTQKKSCPQKCGARLTFQGGQSPLRARNRGWWAVGSRGSTLLRIRGPSSPRTTSAGRSKCPSQRCPVHDRMQQVSSDILLLLVGGSS
jgi:hypothetical protein